MTERNEDPQAPPVAALAVECLVCRQVMPADDYDAHRAAGHHIERPE